MRRHDYQIVEAVRNQAATEVMNQIRRDRQQSSERIGRMLRYIEEHLFDPGLNVQTLRLACQMRDNSLAIRFHQEVQEPPKTYITARRMETGARLLCETDLRIWQIGYCLGYSSLGVFSKAFCRWSGERPLAYRKRHESDGNQALLASMELGKKALTGRLQTAEAALLLRRLLELYPEAARFPTVETANV